ncbi:MAG: hypothetical protein DSM106950_03750 [Stigonema ocellatum SAG 48.90 = DSM 106950]|nr:hypothetical protein [Stigonema ocellatum SAG 48.90 = DSM 106950]
MTTARDSSTGFNPIQASTSSTSKPTSRRSPTIARITESQILPGLAISLLEEARTYALTVRTNCALSLVTGLLPCNAFMSGSASRQTGRQSLGC